MTYDGYSEIEVISAVLLGTLATASLIATIITLYLICDMNRWNGYMLLIFNLTLFQAIYDISFYFLLAFRSDACFQIFTFLAVFSGLAVSLWTNIISFVLFYIVMWMKSFHIKYYIKFFFVFIVALSGVIATLTVVFSYRHPIMLNRIQRDYYLFRIFSIIANVAIHFAIQFKLYRLGLSSLNNINTGGRFVNLKAINDPLKILSARLKYYPIVQIFTWAGAAWYEFEYGFNRDSFDADRHYSVWQQVCIYVDVICSPTAGLGFFIIFLVVQPTALAHLKFKIKHFCSFRGMRSDAEYHKLNSEFQYSRKGSHSIDSAFTSQNEALHSAESFTDPFMSNGDELEIASASSQHSHVRRLPTGSFYEMDEEELAQQMESKYSIHKNSFTYFDAGGGGGSASLSVAGGGLSRLHQGGSNNNLSGLNTVNLSHINSISNIIGISGTSPGAPSNGPSGVSLRGRTGSGHHVNVNSISGNGPCRIKSDSSQDGIDF